MGGYHFNDPYILNKKNLLDNWGATSILHRQMAAFDPTHFEGFENLLRGRDQLNDMHIQIGSATKWKQPHGLLKEWMISIEPSDGLAVYLSLAQVMNFKFESNLCISDMYII